MPSITNTLPPPYSFHKASLFGGRRAASNPLPTHPQVYPIGNGLFSSSPQKQQSKPQPVANKSRNRSLSLRSKNKHGDSGGKRSFGFGSVRGNTQPELSKKLYRLIKSENHVINAHTNAGREQISIASQLSDWGLHTSDDAVSDVSDKIGVMLAELGEMEITYAHNLEDFRTTLKTIRNVEQSVQPSRDKRNKITDEIQRLKYKEPQSPKIYSLEQELVRVEAENLVAEAQLSNVTRQKLKEAYAQHFAAMIERSQKQEILAKHARRLLALIDDTPLVPGDPRPAYDLEQDARQILADAEEDLRNWKLEIDEVPSNAVLDPSLMPSVGRNGTNGSQQTAVLNGKEEELDRKEEVVV